MTKRTLLVIHGLGEQKPGFAKGLAKRISKSEENPPIVKEVYWADLYDDPAHEALEHIIESENLRNKRLRRKVVLNIGDIVGYLVSRESEATSYHAIHERIDAAIADAEGTVTVAAHSLGSVIAMDALARHASNIGNWKRLVTFGSPVPMFLLHDARDRIPDAGPLTKAGFEWTNIFDPDDILAAPFAKAHDGLARLAEAGVLFDERMQVGGLIGGRMWTAHMAYWTDRGFVRRLGEIATPELQEPKQAPMIAAV